MMRFSIWIVLVIGLVVLAHQMIIRPVFITNAHILTLDSKSSVADAMLIERGRFVAIGSQASIGLSLPPFTKTLDLHGQTIVPGFIDAHSHFPSAGLTEAGVDMTPPPTGNVATLRILLNKISEAASLLPENDWVVGFNYDDSALDVFRHPTKEELDSVAPNHPVYLWHRSGHMGVANSLALKALGFSEISTHRLGEGGHALPDRDDKGRLTGLLQGEAAAPMSFLLRQLSIIRLFKALLFSRDQYLSAGITTAQNGFADIASMQLLKWSQRLGLIPQRLVIWPAHTKVENSLSLGAAESLQDPSSELAQALGWHSNPSNFAITAIKLVADGSPQGGTAWLSEPYMNIPEHSSYRGHPHVPELEFKSLVQRYHNAGFQLAMHANGDAAIDLVIQSVEQAQAQNYRADTRHIVVHGQLMRPDQIARLAELDMTATFFPSHVYYWGDWYLNTMLGEERANNISPLALAEELGVRYTIHSDAPVTPISPMQVMWSATTRDTLSGVSLGTEFAISRESALRAMTIDAAWQSRLEHDRGSIEVGKLADFVVLSEDPLTYSDVRNINVQQVWIGGDIKSTP